MFKAILKTIFEAVVGFARGKLFGKSKDDYDRKVEPGDDKLVTDWMRGKGPKSDKDGSGSKS